MKRNRAWRRFEACKHRNKPHTKDIFKPEKNWKLLYLRSEKLARAKQLGIDYPIKSMRQLLEIEACDG